MFLPLIGLKIIQEMYFYYLFQDDQDKTDTVDISKTPKALNDEYNDDKDKYNVDDDSGEDQTPLPDLDDNKENVKEKKAKNPFSFSNTNELEPRIIINKASNDQLAKIESDEDSHSEGGESEPENPKLMDRENQSFNSGVDDDDDKKTERYTDKSYGQDEIVRQIISKILL